MSKYMAIFILAVVIILIATAQTGGLIRDLSNDVNLRSQVANALALSTVINDSFAGAAATDTVTVYGIIPSTSLVTAHPYGTAVADSVGVLYAYMPDTNQVVVARIGTLLEANLKYIIKVHRF